MNKRVNSALLEDVERSLGVLARRTHSPHIVHKANTDPLNELAKLIGETHEPYPGGSHDILMRALGVEPARPVRVPYLREAFYERPFFHEEGFLARRRWNLSQQRLNP